MKPGVRFSLIAISCAMFAAGSGLWAQRHGDIERSHVISAASTIGLSTDSLKTGSQVPYCSRISKDDSVIVFMMYTNLVFDNKFRGYFETSPESTGLYVEFDPAESSKLRLGINGVDNKFTTTIRTVRREEEFAGVFAVSKGGVRIVGSGVNKYVPFPASFVPSINCSSVKVGEADNASCLGCDILVEYGFLNSSMDTEVLFDALPEGESQQLAQFGGLLLQVFAVVMFSRAFTGQKIRARTNHELLDGRTPT